MSLLIDLQLDIDDFVIVQGELDIQNALFSFDFFTKLDGIFDMAALDFCLIDLQKRCQKVTKYLFILLQHCVEHVIVSHSIKFSFLCHLVDLLCLPQE